MGTLSRNTDDANGHIDKIFDKDKIQTDQRVTQLAEQVMQQTASNVLNQLSVNAKDDAAKKLASDAAYQAADAGQRKSMEDAAFLAVDQKYGIGSPYWTAATAISGALAGLTGGDMGQALAGGLAPYLSQEVKKVTGDSAVANTVGHALAGAVTAYIQGGSVTGGAAGGAAGELAAKIIISAFYPNTKPEDLTEDQKANVSALSTLAAGLAGGVAGNSSLAGVQGAIAGKAAVENNFLSEGRPKAYTEKLKSCDGNTDCEQGVRKDLAKESADNIQKLKSCWDAGDSACVTQMRATIDLNEAAYTELRVQDNMVGRAYEDSAKWYADIIDNCAGKCGWLEASLLKTGADGLSNAAYGALGVGSLPKPGQTVTPEVPTTGAKGTIPSSPAESAFNGARLNMQLSAEQAAGAKAPTKITSYSQHALDQIAGRDGGIGVSQSALNSAWSNPLKIEYVPSKYGPTFRYTGNDAVIVINAEGKVVTGWAKSSSGTAK